jgi:hypothetical protein
MYTILASSPGPDFARGLVDVVIVFLFIVGIFLAMGVRIWIAYLALLQRALLRCSVRSRTMRPGLVWLNLVPLFGVIWSFITIFRVSESLQNEFGLRRMRHDGDCGRSIGLFYLSSCLLGLYFVRSAPALAAIVILAGLVCFVMHGAQIMDCSWRLAMDDEREWESQV